VTTVTATSRGVGDPVAEEQRVLDNLYDLLDAETRWTATALRRASQADVGATPSAILDRDALVNDHRMRLAQLQAAVDRLCFGRIDRTDGTSFHLGRVGLARPDGGARALLDWRAPAAAAFYQATGASPMGLKRRRHVQTRGRRVTGVDDELLELMTASSEGDAVEAALDTNSALLAALNAPRDGRMHEVVATIQAEQDRIIRAPLAGVLVVQGAPGTGKTVVALHRAAYLLYTYRQQLSSGVLVIGPGEAFLDYIRQVLPSLGETGATLASLAALHPGVVGTADEPAAVAALKGDLRMARVLRGAVQALPRVPDSAVPLDVDGDRVLLRPADVAAAMRRARAEDLTHNVARVTFVREILERLVRGLARATGYAPEDVAGANRVELLRALHASRDVRREVNRCWPLITPERLLRRLYRDPAALSAAAPELSRAERDRLYRDSDRAWSLADVALLDEAAELLGEDPEPARRRAAARAAAQADEVRYAQGVTQLLGPGAILDGRALAARYAGDDGAAESDAGGPPVYGHVVVDEAQELTAMQWRAVLRRCPSRSMTLVGDIAQGTSPGAAASWAAALTPHLSQRWSVAELTVNYRLPRQINELAHAVLAATGGDVGSSQARAVRDRADSVRLRPAPAAGMIETEVIKVVREVISGELANGSGTLAVLAPPAAVASLSARLSGWDGRLSVMTPVQAKGLEFDVVVVVTPDELFADAGTRGLYVALTRATQQLHVIGKLPTVQAPFRREILEPSQTSGS